MLERARAALSAGGVRRLVAAGMDYLGVYRCADWFELGLDPVPTSDPPDVAVQIEELDETRLAAYVEYRAGAGRAAVRRRLDAGHVCYVAWRGDRIVSSLWGTDDRIVIPYLHRAPLRLSEGRMYVYDAFTRPGMRGLRILPVTHCRLLAHFADRGCRRAILVVGGENRSMIRSAVGVGYRRTGSIGSLRLGPVRWDFLRGPDARF